MICTCGFTFRLLNGVMSAYACIIVKTILYFKCIQFRFCFTIDKVDDKIIVSFIYACKREQYYCECLIDVYYYNPCEVSLPFDVSFQI